jgi:hypothetical protein
MQTKPEVNVQTSKYGEFLKLFLHDVNDDVLSITEKDIHLFEMCKELHVNK